jgi:excisionase family DNA binding protein
MTAAIPASTTSVRFEGFLNFSDVHALLRTPHSTSSAQPAVDRHPPVIPEPRLVGVKLAARALGISEHSVWREVRDVRLRSFKYGTRTLIPVTALDEWVAAHLG